MYNNIILCFNGLIDKKCAIYNNHKIIKDRLNTERFIEFIDTFIKGKYKNHLVILDNAKAHNNDEVKNKILETTNKYLFSIPYIPKTNAIEAYFNQLKHHLSLLPPCNSFDDIKKENYKNYFIYTYNKNFYKHLILINLRNIFKRKIKSITSYSPSMRRKYSEN